MHTCINMYIHMYFTGHWVAMQSRICTCIYVCTYLHIWHILMLVCKTYMHVFMCVYMYIYLSTTQLPRRAIYVHVYMNIQYTYIQYGIYIYGVYEHVYTYIMVYMNIHVHTCIHTYIYMYIHVYIIHIYVLYRLPGHHAEPHMYIYMYIYT